METVIYSSLKPAITLPNIYVHNYVHKYSRFTWKYKLYFSQLSQVDKSLCSKAMNTVKCRAMNIVVVDVYHYYSFFPANAKLSW